MKIADWQEIVCKELIKLGVNAEKANLSVRYINTRTRSPFIQKYIAVKVSEDEVKNLKTSVIDTTDKARKFLKYFSSEMTKVDIKAMDTGKIDNTATPASGTWIWVGIDDGISELDVLPDTEVPDIEKVKNAAFKGIKTMVDNCKDKNKPILPLQDNKGTEIEVEKSNKENSPNNDDVSVLEPTQTSTPQDDSDSKKQKESIRVIIQRYIEEARGKGLPLNIILSGPPGTGKTYVGKQLCTKLADPNMCKGVCFHPATSYEDFVRALQMVSGTAGLASYKPVNKVFGQICDEALVDPDHKYAIFIDEINRANLPAVLGELMNGLEYRGEAITVPYEVELDTKTSPPERTPPKLIVPKNLLVIGTMNTADRSTGLLDYAIRRRFVFFHLLPDPEQVIDEKAQGIFLKVLSLFVKNATSATINWSERADTLSRDFHPSDVAIGHTYFMKADWETRFQYQVFPMLIEYIKDGVLVYHEENRCSQIEKYFYENRNANASDFVSNLINSKIL